MGRIKTTMIKRVTLKLFRDHSDEFKTSSDDNKKVIETLADTKSKKLRNIIAGYVTRLKKKEIV